MLWCIILLPKWREYAKNRCECTKIAKVIENSHLRLEMNDDYKDRYCIFFEVPEHPSKEALPPWTPPQGPLPFDPTKCFEIWKVNTAIFFIFAVLHPGGCPEGCRYLVESRDSAPCGGSRGQSPFGVGLEGGWSPPKLKKNTI